VRGKLTHNEKNKKKKIKKIIYKFYSKYSNYEIVAEKIMFQYHFDKFLKNSIIEKKDHGYVLC
jgi:hypothetical protein